MKNKQVRKSNNKIVKASKFSVPTHPPDFTAVPWYHLILRIQSPPASTISTETIRSHWSTQLGLTTTTDGIDVRLNSIRVWGSLVTTASAVLQPLRLAVYDPVGSSSTSVGTGGIGRRLLDVVVDYPDQVTRASVGYRFSGIQKQVAIGCPNAGTTPLFEVQGAGTDSIIYIDLLWRTPNITGIID